MEGTRDIAASLEVLLARAVARRAAWIPALEATGTDAYRLFHGVSEGWPGLTIDRYGPLVLAQTFREPLESAQIATLAAFARSGAIGTQLFVYNHRSDPRQGGNAPFARWHEPAPEALAELVCREHGVQFEIRARHRGRDPWLFLDLRDGRRRLCELAPGKSVLNLFAYTCGAGIAAAKAGASEVWNVDFASSALDVGRRNAARNGVDSVGNDGDGGRVRFLAEDCLPVLRQLAGFAVKGRGAAHAHAQVERRRFDIVFLDPPAWSKGPFGAVDVERDYESLFKPALACTQPGGWIIATNHSANVELGAWLLSLERCARKSGGAIEIVETLGPGPDFPSLDGRAPLKIAVCAVVGIASAR
ncbi:MAG: class I SAM-dependent rRNA methyltransferase [Planctomycetota bacterium]